MVERVFPQIEEWLKPALEANAMGENVKYEIFPIFDPQGSGLNLYFMFSIPSILLGEYVTAMLSVPFHLVMNIDENAVNNIVQNGLQQLREARTSQAEIPDQAEMQAHLQNGNTPKH